MTGTVAAGDGRRIAYFDGGDPAGHPVIGLHGTPGCRYARWPDDDVYARAGVRYVTTDRAGYGRSTRHRGRTVADAAADVLAVADALGLDRFGVTGGSGGGPHALACGALPAGRVERVSCLSGLAPLGAGGLDRASWLAGMDPEDADELLWAEDGEARLAAELPARQAAMAAHVAGDVTGALGEQMSEADRAYLARPEAAVAFRRVVAEQCRDGVDGWADDSLTFVRPWGFDVGAVAVPMLLVWGLTDVSVPPPHGEWLAAHLPDVRTVVDAEGGHLPTDPLAEIAQNRTWCGWRAANPGSSHLGGVSWRS